jgi:hemolysin activation/secretion protein
MTRPSARAVPPRLLVLALAAALPAYAPSHAQTAVGGARAAGVVRDPAPTVRVQRYEVTGNTLLPAEQIERALAVHVGERDLPGLRAAAQAVQALYREAGYGAVVAFVPEQTRADGVVTIRVIEGKVSKVEVVGATRFGEGNVRESLPSLVEGETPRVRRIDAQVQLANENPAKRTEVLLQPGANPGEVEARVQVEEQPPSRFTVGLDNTGNRQPGRLRANLGYQNANLFGRDQVLSLQAQVAPEKLDAVTVLSGNYRIPFYSAGMALDAYAAYSDVNGGSTPTAAGALQFAGKGRIAGLRLSTYLPRLGEIDQRLVLGLDHRDYDNDCSIAGLPPGACGPAGESVSVQPLAVEYIVQKGGRNAWGASIGLQHNLQIGGGHAADSRFAAVRPGSAPHYTLLRLGLFSGLTLTDDWQLQTRLVGQATNDALVPGEQFGIGGAASVRGYDEREVTGDSGASASVELVGPNLLGLPSPGGGPLRGGSLRPVLFADVGWVRNRLGTPCRVNETECSLAGVGAGLRYAAGPLQAKLDVAYALRAGNRTDRHATRAHFSVSYSF